MNLRKLQFIIIFFVFILFIPSDIYSQQNKTLGGVMLLPPSALDDFAPEIYKGKNKDNIFQWISDRNGKYIRSGNRVNGELFVVYRSKLLIYWFGPFSSKQNQLTALQKLQKLRDELNISDVFVTPFFVDSSRPISFSKFGSFSDDTPVFMTAPNEIKNRENDINDAVRTLKKLKVSNLPSIPDYVTSKQLSQVKNELRSLSRQTDKLITMGMSQSQGQAMKKLQKKYSSGSKNTTKANGLKGLFPVDYSFSKWFAMTVDVVAKTLDCIFFNCELKSKVEKFLVLAYMIMPDIMNDIASMLAKFQDKITDDKLDEQLNNIADDIEPAYELFKALEKLQNLYNEPSFQDMLKDPNLGEAINAAIQATEIFAPEIKNKLPKDFGKVVSLLKCIPLSENSKLDPYKCFKGKLEEGGKMLFSKELSKRPEFKKLNPDAFIKLYEDGDYKKFVKTQGKHIICQSIPGNQNENCSKALDGKFQEAFEGAIFSEIEKNSRIPSRDIAKVFELIKKEEFKEAAKSAAKAIARAGNKEYLGEYSPLVDEILEKGVSKRLSKEFLEVFAKKNIDNPQLVEVLGTGVDIFDDILNEGEINFKKATKIGLNNLGFSAEAAENILKGNYGIEVPKLMKELAMELQLTSPEAIDHFIKGRYQDGLDAQFEYLKNQNYGKGGQLKHLKQIVKNKKEYSKILARILEELAKNKNHLEQIILEDKVQTPSNFRSPSSSYTSLNDFQLKELQTTSFTKKIKFHIRSFHPNERFGETYGALDDGFKGDNRGFSTSLHVPSKINHSFILDMNNKNILYNPKNTFSHQSTWYTQKMEFDGAPMQTSRPPKVRKFERKATSEPKGEVSSLKVKGNSYEFTTKYSGKNPLIPAPYIDVQASFKVVDNIKNGYLSISYKVKGDDFPNTEMFIEDSSGKKLFLGVRERDLGRLINNDNFPIILLGDATTDIINNKVKVLLDENGDFIGILHKGKTYKVHDWNKLYYKANESINYLD